MRATARGATEGSRTITRVATLESQIGECHDRIATINGIQSEIETVQREIGLSQTEIVSNQKYIGKLQKEIEELDRWIRKNTRERFGPVRSVQPHYVFEIGFEGISKSSRHKSGIAVRFPRILRWRKDKPSHEADSLSNAMKLLNPG